MKTSLTSKSIFKTDWPVGLGALLYIFPGFLVALAGIWVMNLEGIVLSLYDKMIFVAWDNTVFSMAGAQFAVPTIVFAALFCIWGIFPLSNMKHDRKSRANWYWKPAIVGLLLGLQSLGIAYLIYSTNQLGWILLVLASYVTFPIVSLFTPEVKNH